MPISAGAISKSDFQKFRTREGKGSQYDEYLKFALNMEDGTAAELSHTFENDEGEVVTAVHSDKGTCPISSYVMNQRGRLNLRKGMFRSSHNDVETEQDPNGMLLLYRTLPEEVKSSQKPKSEAADMTDDEADAARENGTA